MPDAGLIFVCKLERKALKSVICLMNRSDFKQKHIVQDFAKKLSCKNRSEFNNIDYSLIDFLEERFDPVIG